jgi:hypothetical protein
MLAVEGDFVTAVWSREKVAAGLHERFEHAEDCVAAEVVDLLY